MKKLLFLFCLFISLNAYPSFNIKNLLVKVNALIFKKEIKAKKAKIATLFINGEIDHQNINKIFVDLVNIKDNNEFEGIILVIRNSGGGASLHSVVHDLLKKIKSSKPIICLIISALSAGYLIATACDYIIAHSCSEIGSIGALVNIIKYKNPRLKSNEGIESDINVKTFTGGQFKGMYNSFEENLTDEQQKWLDNDVQKAYKDFLRIVAENRNLNLNNYKDWAEGKYFCSSDALKLGLIDEIGTIFEARNKIVELLRKRKPNVFYDDDIEEIQVFYDK